MKRASTAAGLLAVYIGSIVTANYLTTRYGLVAVFPGLVTTAGTVVIGGVIMSRDFLQDAIGRLGVLAALLAGAGLSYLISSHQIAVASAVTFLIAEGLELAVYTPLRRRVGWGTGRWGGVVGLANVTGAVADTLLFLTLAGFPLTVATAGGQVLGKAYVTAAVIAAGLGIRRARRRGVRVTLRMAVSKDCPYKPERDDGELVISLRGDAPELHALAERIRALADEPVTHEDYTRAVRALLPRGSAVVTRWQTGPWHAEVTAGHAVLREPVNTKGA